MNSILITGATGGLGRNAAERAAREFRFVRATGRNPVALEKLSSLDIDVQAMDLAMASDRDLSRLVQGCDTIWHCAGLAAPWGAKNAFTHINVRASEALYRAAMREGCKTFVFISTPSIYFDYTPRFDIEESFRPARFVNHYASSKAEAERVLNAWALEKDTPRLIHLRPRAIFGPYDQVLFPRLMRIVESNKGVLPLPEGGAAMLDMTYVDNVVEAMILASRCPAPSGRAFNVTNDEPVLLRDVLESLFERLDRPLRIRPLPYPVLDLAARGAEFLALLTGREPALTRYGIGSLAKDMTLDITRARRELNYVPIVSMREAIHRTAQWTKENG